MNTVQRARTLAQPVCDRLGLFLWDVRFEKEGALWYLRIFIDRSEGVDMDICEEFSREFNEILDREDFINVQYVFEAGSPGLGRRLTRREHFTVCEGDEIRIKLFKEKNGSKQRRGLLCSSDDNGFTVAYRVDDDGDPTETESFLYKECSSVNLNDDEDLFG